MSTYAGDAEVVQRAVEALRAGRRVEESFRVLHETFYEPLWH